MGNFEKRPVLHFSPRGGWINDPNGLTYDGKRYHLYAQHNPEDIVWGPMHWLHATSGDLLAWEEHGVALFPDDLGTAFSGSVVIDGVAMETLSPASLRKRRREITMIFQQFNLLMQRTCLKNVCFPMELAGVKKAEAEKRAMELLEMVGLPDKANAYPAQLSGGQKQRIAIARALATNPKVLLCDEATSALDPNTTHSILTLIKDINRKLGITVVVITHQMSVVEEICDSVAILDGGMVVEQGSVQEIFANPKTAAAKRLVAPNGGSAARDLSSFAPDDHVVRVTFNGSSAAKPLVASLAAEKGILVSVLSADTRDLSGQCYGSMLLKLPADVELAKQAAAYMRSQPGVTVEEVTGE